MFYVITNIALALYTAVVLTLMIRRRKAAIVNSIVLNCLTVVFLTVWHLLGEKSPFGTIVDSVMRITLRTVLAAADRGLSLTVE